MTEIGVCAIKPEFIVEHTNRTVELKYVAEKDKAEIPADNGETPNKKIKLSKNLKGQNKARGPTYVSNKSEELCSSLMHFDGSDNVTCERKNCQFLHDAKKYLETKPKDIGDTCYNFITSGKCDRGLTCRFGSGHINEDGHNIIDQKKFELYSENNFTKNHLSKDLQWSLRKRTVNFNLAETLVKYNDKIESELSKKENDSEIKMTKEIFKELTKKTQGAITDEDIIKVIQREKKKIDFKRKLMLSPLTTVGNLPFRRICKEFGADITCGEMAMCSSLLQGTSQEWALLKRHSSENIFGVQLCANNPHLFAKCGQLFESENIEVDFVDINLGCPIDFVYKSGAGSGLLNRSRALKSSIRSLSQILSVPLTIKTRTGVYSDTNVAHKLVPEFAKWGISMATVHGRSREQRYTRSANWEYINEVALAAKPLPVFGNGDILSYEDYEQALTKYPEIQGVMIGRGALIKPWLFTEIKEKKLWDISSGERFDIIKKYANYGLEHWGSDTKGVENTRRFLLEWLSFLYRYIPVGILEHPPQKINQRPPFYKGRDDLETLMSSSSVSDWVKISEMVLGPVPDHFKFLPKHKANSYQ